MSQRSLEEFKELRVYQKAQELFRACRHRYEVGSQREPLCYKLVSQQIGSADSICAKIEEGHGRLSRRRVRSLSSISPVRSERVKRAVATCVWPLAAVITWFGNAPTLG